MALMRSALLWASRNQWLARQFPNYRFAKAAVRRFMPGTTAEAALDATASFTPTGITTVLTRLGENLARIEDADAVFNHYAGLLEMISHRGAAAQISVKLTQLGLDISESAALQHVRNLAALAAPAHNVVWIDMEDSSYVDRTLDLFLAALDDRHNIGLCLQSYLFRTEKDLLRILPRTAAVRLVKGAYNEPPSLAWPARKDVDDNYFRLGRMMLDATRSTPPGPPPAFGTHDPTLVHRLAEAAAANGIARSAFEIQMLYGIQSAEQLRLASAGHSVRILVSYGEDWFPWYVRRLAERPANVWFVVRNLFGG
ncbi:MAG: proline dehydrogenase family protein [Longimicrobiales bacterium]